MICFNCQACNSEEANFCLNCGTPLKESCPNCGHKNVVRANFCIECGHALKTGNEFLVEEQENSIQKFIPKEYAAKLKTARKAQTMKGERRIVSILFCDVKGSTAMAETLDPEIWAEIMNRAFEYLISAIYKYEGTLARLMGDSVLAFFGAPIAHEDDARRAILAGLEIVESIQPFKEEVIRKYDLDFDVRVGINTGLVVVGGVGSDLFMEYTALGDAINIAARMEQTALPGTIQIGEDTYKQAARFFEFEPLGGIEIKGKSTPVKTYRVLGVKEKVTLKQGVNDEQISLVGRSTELNTLLAAMENVRDGRGGIVCLISESGLGKSRLLDEARQSWEQDRQEGQPLGMISSRWNQVSCVSYESSRPYGLLQRLIRNYFGVSPSDTVAVVRENFSETAAMLGKENQEEWLDLFEIVLGFKDRMNSGEIPGERLKQKIFAVMLEILSLAAQQDSLVIAVDDLHWADAASVEFLVHLFQLADRLPVLFLCSFRPHHASQAWLLKQAAEIDYAHRYTQINLSPLSDDESKKMIDQLFGGASLPEHILQAILKKSEGNPFFMSEVARGLIDEKKIILDQSAGKWAWNTSVTDISIPDNLNSVLTARIDRLDETAKRVLQMASVVGRSFDYQVLDLINDTTDELDMELINIQRLGLIQEVSREPEIEYMFRQALTYETAYNTILLKHRREYHRRVGEALLQLLSDRVEENSSLLAHHFYQAHDRRALKYLKMKGDSAYRLYANVEAIDAYKKALEAAKWDDSVDLAMMAELYTCLGRVYELISEFTLAQEAYKELEKLAIELGDVNVELTALISQALIISIPSSEFNFDLGVSIVQKARKMAEELDEKEALAKLNWISMNLNRFNRNPKDSQKDGERAIALARELNLNEQLAYILNDAAHSYTMNGDMAKAREVSLEATELWEGMDNLPMLADSLAGLAAISVYSGEYDQAYEYSDQAYQISVSIENVWGQAYSRYSIGLVDFDRGNVDLAIKHFEQTIRDARISKFTAGEYLGRANLSLIYAEFGLSELALDVLEKGDDLEKGNFAVTRAFFIGASLLAYVRSREMEAAEKIMDQFKDGFEGGYFIANHYFTLGKCYYHLFTGSYDTVLEMTNEFYLKLEKTGVAFLNAEVLLIMGIAFIRLGKFAEAKSKLIDAAKFADRLSSRKTRWKIDYYIGVCLMEEGKVDDAEKYFVHSKENLEYILDHIFDPEMKASLLAKEEVIALTGRMEKIN